MISHLRSFFSSTVEPNFNHLKSVRNYSLSIFYKFLVRPHETIMHNTTPRAAGRRETFLLRGAQFYHKAPHLAPSATEWHDQVRLGLVLKVWDYMDVSENNGIPKSSILIGFSIINHPFWGTPIFGNTYDASMGRLYIYISTWNPSNVSPFM